MKPAKATTGITVQPEPRVLPSPAALAEPLGGLMEYLGELHVLLQRLTELSREKLASLRRADTEGLQSCAARERELLERVFRAAQGRAAVLARLAQALHIADLKDLRLVHFAERLPEPHASALRARIAALEQSARQLQQKNEIAATVAHNLQSHIRGVFAALAKATQEHTGYGPKGMPEMTSTRCWVDAVG